MKHQRGSFFYSLFRLINVLRLTIVNGIFFLCMIILISFIVHYNSEHAVKQVHSGSVLLIAPSGKLVEKTDDVIWEDYLLQNNTVKTLLSDITDALVRAAHDRRIAAVFFDVSRLSGISAGHFSEFKKALSIYKESRKPLYVFSTQYSLGSYYLASFADKIYLDPMGAVTLSGFYSESLFYGDMEKRFGMQWNVIQAGAYKGMAETYARSGMSDAVRGNYRMVFKDLWASYVQEVADHRGSDAQLIERYAHSYGDRLEKSNGSAADAALGAGLVTHIASYQEAGFDAGFLDETYRFIDSAWISYKDYNATFKQAEMPYQIGVIHVTGVISDNRSASTYSEASSETIALFMDAIADPAIKAIVLRIDSGGGEVFASERIRRAVELATQKAGKPVIASMGSVAASGAYWIASSADYIFCSPYTITGSIGVLGTLPTFQRALKDYFGIQADGVSSLERLPYSVFRQLDDEEKRQAQLEIAHTYTVFLEKVSKGRNIPIETVKDLAQGKIYSGVQAKNVQLADEIGSFSDAVSYAAVKAGVKEQYALKILKPKYPLKDEIIRSLLLENARIAPQLCRASDMQVLYELLQLTSKQGLYVYSPIRAVWQE